MTTTAVVLHRGSKVFWKVRCTVEIVVINHGAHDVLEVICYEPILSHEAARIYLRHSALLREVAKEDAALEEATENADVGRERKLNLLVNFITERLQIKLYNPKTRLFQIEFQQQQLTESASEKQFDIECTRPFYLEPFVLYPGVVSKDLVHQKNASSPSNGSDATYASLSRSRSRDEAHSAHDTASVHSALSARSDNNCAYAYGIASGCDDRHLHDPAHEGCSQTRDAGARGISLDLNDGYVSTSARNRLPFSRSDTRTSPATMHATRTHTHTGSSPFVSTQPSPAVTPRISPSTTPRTGAHTQAPRTYTHARRRSSIHVGSHIPAQQASVAAASNATHHAVGSHHSTQHPHNPQHSLHAHHAHHTIHANYSHSPKGSHTQQSSFAHDTAHTPHAHTPTNADVHGYTYTTHPTNPPQHALTLTTHTTPFHLRMKPKLTHKESFFTRMSNSVHIMCNSLLCLSLCGGHGSSAVHSVVDHSDTKGTSVGARSYSVSTARDSSDHDTSISH